jgi:hypothetical protein
MHSTLFGLHYHVFHSTSVVSGTPVGGATELRRGFSGGRSPTTLNDHRPLSANPVGLFLQGAVKPSVLVTWMSCLPTLSGCFSKAARGEALPASTNHDRQL